MLSKNLVFVIALSCLSSTHVFAIDALIHDPADGVDGHVVTPEDRKNKESDVVTRKMNTDPERQRDEAARNAAKRDDQVSSATKTTFDAVVAKINEAKSAQTFAQEIDKIKSASRLYHMDSKTIASAVAKFNLDTVDRDSELQLLKDRTSQLLALARKRGSYSFDNNSPASRDLDKQVARICVGIVDMIGAIVANPAHPFSIAATQLVEQMYQEDIKANPDSIAWKRQCRFECIGGEARLPRLLLKHTVRPEETKGSNPGNSYGPGQMPIN